MRYTSVVGCSSSSVDYDFKVNNSFGVSVLGNS